MSLLSRSSSPTVSGRGEGDRRGGGRGEKGRENGRSQEEEREKRAR